MRKPWPKISEMARLVESGPSADAIGTAADVGDAEDVDIAQYDLNTSQEEDLNSFAGIARAMAFGSLRRAVKRGVGAGDIVSALLARVLPQFGSVETAIDHLSFIPSDNDLFDGARIELVNNVVVGYNGYEGKPATYNYTSVDDMIDGFIKVGAHVLPGMVMSLLERR